MLIMKAQHGQLGGTDEQLSDDGGQGGLPRGGVVLLGSLTSLAMFGQTAYVDRAAAETGHLAVDLGRKCEHHSLAPYSCGRAALTSP